MSAVVVSTVLVRFHLDILSRQTHPRKAAPCRKEIPELEIPLLAQLQFLMIQGRQSFNHENCIYSTYAIWNQEQRRLVGGELKEVEGGSNDFWVNIQTNDCRSRMSVRV